MSRRQRDGDTPRAKSPQFAWYPGDHRRDTAVQTCCFEARGLWREMLDLMHDGEPYGHLTAGGVAIAPIDLARIVGVALDAVERWLQQLEERRVFSRTQAGVIFSRRMVRDEHIRNVRRAAGKLGGNPTLLKQTRTGHRDLVKQPRGKRRTLLNQSANQNPTPAVSDSVSGLQSASAVKATANSEDAAAVASVSLATELPPTALQLLDVVDRADREAVAREMHQVLNGGCKYKNQVVTATDLRLNAKCRDTLAAIAQRKVRVPGKAWPFTLAKLADTSETTSARDRLTRADVAAEERATAADVERAERWIATRPHLDAVIERELAGSRVTFRTILRRSRVLAAWREAGAP